MQVEKFQTSKENAEPSKLILRAENEDDRKLLEDLLEYLEYRKQELEHEKQF